MNFPDTLFHRSGRGILSNKRYARLYRDEDKDSAGGCMFKISFKTCVVSDFGPRTFKRELKDAFSKGLEGFEIVHVVP